MTEYNEPNRFCGECGAYAAFGEPETTPEQNEAILEGCKQCQGWQHMGIQLLNKDNVGQCWNCMNQIDKELINTFLYSSPKQIIETLIGLLDNNLLKHIKIIMVFRQQLEKCVKPLKSVLLPPFSITLIN